MTEHHIFPSRDLSYNPIKTVAGGGLKVLPKLEKL
jgi:hypothetical protein